MIRSAVKQLSRAAISRSSRVVVSSGRPSLFPPLFSRSLHGGINSQNVNPVALQMIDYALSLPKSQKPEAKNEWYEQGMRILEQCIESQSTESDEIAFENSKKLVLLAMSSLLTQSGNYDDAIQRLHNVRQSTHVALGIRVAALEALVGLNLEAGRLFEIKIAKMLAEECLEILDNDEVACSLKPRAKAAKALVALVCGDLESAESFFDGFQDSEGLFGSAALTYGEFLHVTGKFPLAKDWYQKVIQRMAENKDFSDTNALASSNMTSTEVLLAAICSLGQLEAHMGNFSDAEETLTKALTTAEKSFGLLLEDFHGLEHPKVGVVLTCLALMYRHKAKVEKSSSLLIQEGLYRKAIGLLKAPALDTRGFHSTVCRSDVIALARGGYGEVLCVQENRKNEGEQMKEWAEDAWRNNRLSLAEALTISESSNKVVVVDSRIGRTL